MDCSTRVIQYNTIQDSSKQGRVQVEVDLGQTKHMTRKPDDRANEARTGNGKAREDRDRIVPKNDMVELDKEAKSARSSTDFCHKVVWSRCCQNFVSYGTLAKLCGIL